MYVRATDCSLSGLSHSSEVVGLWLVCSGLHSFLHCSFVQALDAQSPCLPGQDGGRSSSGLSTRERKRMGSGEEEASFRGKALKQDLLCSHVPQHVFLTPLHMRGAEKACASSGSWLYMWRLRLFAWSLCLLQY